MVVTLPAYDSTKVTARSLTPNQVGTELSSTWTDTALPINADDFTRVGFSFDFGVTNESERGLSLAPRIPFTTATDDLAGTGETATTWTLTLTTDQASIPSSVGSLHGVNTVAPDPWSGTTNIPSSIFTTAGTGYAVEVIGASSSSWTQTGSVFSLVYNFDFHTDYTDSSDGSVVERPQWTIVNDPLWNGLMQFVLTLTIGNVSITAITFAGNTHNWHAGGMGMPMKRRGRVVHDFITGQPYMSDTAVRDGFRDNVMVHPDNFDPSDPLEESPFTPPPGEGVVDDEVDDLE